MTWTTMTRSFVIGLALALAVSVPGRAQVEFPHPTHERLSPTCAGCHEVTETGMTFPDPATCRGCHNGQVAPAIAWDGPAAKRNTVVFDHQDVIAAKAQRLGIEFPCSNCHQQAGGGRMDVARVASIQTCLGCHGGGEHMVQGQCSTCHQTLASASALSVEDVAAIPAPRTHDDTWALTHGAAAAADAGTCAFCHARETCSNCHVNAPEVEAIQSLAPDPRVATLEAGRVPEYPIPPSHVEAGWISAHGAAAENAASCSTCHAQSSCRTCHVDPVPAAVDALPNGARAGQDVVTIQRGQGVVLARRTPASHGPLFGELHGPDAAAATETCQACHAEETCTSCHTGSIALTVPGERAAGGYHPPNFLQRHSASGFSQETECASCHNPEAFCRSCHADLGPSTTGRIVTGFHSRKASFVFGHGQAARQALETCATCHAQRDCLQCHSTSGARRFSPHGPGFDPERLREKNPRLCLYCHGSGILRP